MFISPMKPYTQSAVTPCAPSPSALAGTVLLPVSVPMAVPGTSHVFVCSGCRDQVLEAGGPTDVYSYIFGGWGSKVELLAGSVPGEQALFLAWRRLPPAVSLQWPCLPLSGVSSNNDTNPMVSKLPLLWPHLTLVTSLALLQIQLNSRLGLSHESWDTLQPIASW